jgi:hypothetical protein
LLRRLAALFPQKPTTRFGARNRLGASRRSFLKNQRRAFGAENRLGAPGAISYKNPRRASVQKICLGAPGATYIALYRRGFNNLLIVI